MKNIAYIIARFNEDISWTNVLGDERIVINKGLNNLENVNNVLTYPNIGRESHSYLKYIIDNYYSLPGVLVFTQGNISDHYVYGQKANDPVLLKMLAQDALIHGLSHNEATNFQANGCDPEWNYKNGKWYLSEINDDKCRNGTNKLFGDWFMRIFKMQQPFPFVVYWCSIFAVRKDRILRHPITFYQQLLSEVDWSKNPIEGHFLERSWYYIFCNIL